MRAIVLPMVALLVGMAPPVGAVQVEASAREKLLRLGPMPPVPLDPTNRWSGSDAAADLGQRLFYDANLSRNGSVSCATCHAVQSGFADSRRLARGMGDGTRHTQSLINAAYQRWLTWDGRSDSLWSQALHPFQNDKEMGLTPREVVQRVRDTPALQRRYEAVFGRLPALDDAAGVQAAFVKLGKAIGAFERRIVSGPSPFDRWLERMRAGDSAPTKEFGADAVRGALLFVGKADCVRCHSGPLLSDGEFHMIGVPEGRGGTPVDRGRLEGIELLHADPCNAAGAFSDDPTGPRAKVTLATVPDPEAWGRFRTPSLRAASVTPPYMHQGQLDTLADVVHFYNTLEGASSLDHHSERVLEPLGLSVQEEADLVAFLRAVTGSTPGDVEVARPRPEAPQPLPKSSEISPVGTSQPGISGP
jgi:cytochrome c peroxidase